MDQLQILTVSGITKLIKETLEEKFSSISVIGEISNFKSYSSGHWYFTLKDFDAQISCTMWRGFNNYVFFTPQDGMKIVVSGNITVYPPRGNYQLDVRTMKPAGQGELQLAFEKLKTKLFNEGLFNEEFKKPLPQLPMKIGLVTSIDGAALRDLIAAAKRRFPLVEIVISPCKVQGVGAAVSIVSSIKNLNSNSDVEVIIVSRGGGSIEDLWAFNEEIVARAIFNSKLPIVTGIGHEVDFTISDFVSDFRAATPTAAMEILTPNKNDFISEIMNFKDSSYQNICDLIEDYKENVNAILNSHSFKKPQDIINKNFQKYDFSLNNFQSAIEKRILFLKNKLELLTTKIELNNVDRILKKGFVLVKQQDKFVLRAKNFFSNKLFTLKFYDNEINFPVINEEKNK